MIVLDQQLSGLGIEDEITKRYSGSVSHTLWPVFGFAGLSRTPPCRVADMDNTHDARTASLRFQHFPGSA
jgi:hypothetical protein